MATKSSSRKRAAAGAKKKAKARSAAGKKAVKKAKAGPKSASNKAASTRKPAAKKAAPKKKVATKAKTTKTSTARKSGKSRSGVRKAGPVPVRVRSVEKRFEHLRDALAQKQSELMQAYAAAKNDTRDRMDDGTEDYIDYAVNSYAKDFLLSLTELERQQLQLVREALHRLNRGEYGDCLQCGNEIPVKRLEVSPWVRYCVSCQELEDQGLLPEQSFAEFDDETAADDNDVEEDLDDADDDDDDEDDDDDGDDEDEDGDDDSIEGDALELDDDED